VEASCNRILVLAPANTTFQAANGCPKYTARNAGAALSTSMKL